MTTNATQAKNRVWADRAALLDPDAYEWYGWTSRGIGQFTVTVPAGETWFLLQGWQLKGAAAGDATTVMWFHRSGGIASPLTLPAGTVLQSNGTTAFAYVCRPAKVKSLASYRNPEALWYTRIDKLRTLTLSELSVHVAAGAVSATDTQGFPNTTTKAMIVHQSNQDGAWVGLFGNDAAALNLNAEVSDSHSTRYGLADMLPIRSEMLDLGFRINNATASGAGNAFLEAHGHCFYMILPTNW